MGTWDLGFIEAQGDKPEVGKEKWKRAVLSAFSKNFSGSVSR